MSFPSPASEVETTKVYRREVGKVRILKKLGSGGNGTVFLGQSADFGGDVAIKLYGLNLDPDERPGCVPRFWRECKFASKVVHENVVRVYGCGIENGTPFLIMEHVEGPSLEEVIEHRARLPVKTVVEIGAGLVEGLSALHGHGLVHRDIKPGNVLLAHGRLPRITDFGLARFFLDYYDGEETRLTGSGIAVGTPTHISPEAIMDAHRAGPKADVYSLGATLYHCIAGRPPFEGEDPLAYFRAHLEERPMPLRAIVRATPKELDRVILACLEKEPDRRPTASQLRDFFARNAGKSHPAPPSP